MKVHRHTVSGWGCSEKSELADVSRNNGRDETLGGGGLNQHTTRRQGRVGQIYHKDELNIPVSDYTRAPSSLYKDTVTKTELWNNELYAPKETESMREAFHVFPREAKISFYPVNQFQIVVISVIFLKNITRWNKNTNTFFISFEQIGVFFLSSKMRLQKQLQLPTVHPSTVGTKWDDK